MLVEPKLQEVVVGGMLPGIEACLERECLVSAVTLIFAAIDALAALTRPVGQLETDGGTFPAVGGSGAGGPGPSASRPS